MPRPTLKDVMLKASETSEIIRRFEKCMPCLFGDCDEDPIRSHSQQREGALRSIARDGKVYGVLSELRAYSKQVINCSNANPKIALVGINEASVFYGYCNRHDTELFKAIECGRSLERDNPEQVLALYRRAFSYLVYCITKEQFIWGSHADKSGNLNVEKDFLQRRPKFYNIMCRFWPRMWRPDAEACLDWEWRIIEGNVGVSSVSFFPILGSGDLGEFYRKHIDPATGRMTCPFPFVTFSLIPEEGRTHAIMIWDRLVSPMMGKLKRKMRAKDPIILSKAFNDFVFVRNGDFFVNPDLWERLPESEREKVGYAMRPAVFQDPSKIKVPHVIRFDRAL